MLLHIMAYLFPFLLLSVSFLVSPSLPWKLPAKEFLETFAHTFQMKGVSIYLPDSKTDELELLSKFSRPIWVSPLDRAQKLQKYRATKLGKLMGDTASSYKDILEGPLDILEGHLDILYGHRTFYMDIGHL